MMCSITWRAAYIASLKSASIASAMAHSEEFIWNIFFRPEKAHIFYNRVTFYDDFEIIIWSSICMF